MRTLLIWLFERYALDYWINLQEEKAKKEFQEKHGLADDEVEEALINVQREQHREIFEAGIDYGFEKAMGNKDDRFFY